MWTSLCEFIFFVNLLHSLCVWLFDILTSFWHFDIFFNLNHPSQGHFIVMSNYAQKILLVFIQSNWMYVKHIKACNFLNNGLICNPLALLELWYPALFPQNISFIIMSNRVQKILLVFLQSNWMYVEHIFLYSTVLKTSINNMIPNSKFSNKEILWFNPSIYKVLRIKLPNDLNYNYFELN